MTKRTRAVSTEKRQVPSNIVLGGPRPWHGFGQELEPNQTPLEAMPAAGLDFKVALSPISYGFPLQGSEQTDEQYTAEIKKTKPAYFTADRRVLYRTDDGSVLDVPASGYHTIQNRDIVAMFEEYVKAGDMRIDTMGTFEHGRRNWLLADMNDGFDAAENEGGGDVILGKVLFYFPHIYGEAAFHKTTSISVVCANTLEAAKRQKAKKYSLWHNVEWNEARAAQAEVNLAQSHEEFKQLREDARILREVKLSSEEASILTIITVGKPGVRTEDQPKVYAKVMDLYDGGQPGADLSSRKGTAWGLLNAVTNFTDWGYGTSKTSQQSRLQRAWFGEGNRVKNAARDTLLSFAAGELPIEHLLEQVADAVTVQA